MYKECSQCGVRIEAGDGCGVLNGKLLCCCCVEEFEDELDIFIPWQPLRDILAELDGD